MYRLPVPSNAGCQRIQNMVIKVTTNVEVLKKKCLVVLELAVNEKITC